MEQHHSVVFSVFSVFSHVIDILPRRVCALFVLRSYIALPSMHMKVKDITCIIEYRPSRSSGTSTSEGIMSRSTAGGKICGRRYLVRIRFDS